MVQRCASSPVSHITGLRTLVQNSGGLWTRDRIKFRSAGISKVSIDFGRSLHVFLWIFVLLSQERIRWGFELGKQLNCPWHEVWLWTISESWWHVRFLCYVIRITHVTCKFTFHCSLEDINNLKLRFLCGTSQHISALCLFFEENYNTWRNSFRFHFYYCYRVR